MFLYVNVFNVVLEVVILSATCIVLLIQSSDWLRGLGVCTSQEIVYDVHLLCRADH